MVDPSEIVRPVAKVNRNAWFLRFYLWLWKADVESVDFCRLFWGYVFAIPALIVWAIIAPFYVLFLVGKWGLPKATSAFGWVGSKLWHTLKWLADQSVKIFPESEKPKRQRTYAEPTYIRGSIIGGRGPAKPSWIGTKFKAIRSNGGEMFLGAVGRGADKTVAAAQFSWPYLKWLFIAVGVVFAASIAAATGYLIWLLITSLDTVGSWIANAASNTVEGVWWLIVTVATWGYLWMIPVGIIVTVAVLVLGVILSDKHTDRKEARREARREGREPDNVGFATAMKTGAKSVKYRTCPVIKIEEG